MNDHPTDGQRSDNPGRLHIVGTRPDLPPPAVASLYETAELAALLDGLRERRQRLRLTQATVARWAGISQTAVSRIEAGDPGMKLANVAAYAAALRLTIVVTEPAEREDW